MNPSRRAAGSARLRGAVIGGVICAMTAVSGVVLAPASAAGDGPGSNPSYLVAHGGYVWFSAYENGGVQSLYKSDGTAGGTSLIKSGVDPTNLAWIGNRLFFSGYDTAQGSDQLFESDGTTGGTTPISTVAGGLRSDNFVAFRGGVLFAGEDALGGQEPWFSNGKVGGTHRIKDIYKGIGGSYATAFTVVGGGDTAVFVANTDAHGAELWRTDGTTEGTSMVKDINPGPNWSFSESDLALIAYKKHAYFLANNGVAGFELWTTDGQASGTHMVRNIGPGASDMTDGEPEGQGSQSNFLEAAIYRGDLWFAANDGKHGNELWRTNGTAKGTKLAIDVFKGERGSNPEDLTAVGGHLLFDVQDVKHGDEPWFTGGTAATTHLMRDVNPGPQSSYAYDFVAVPSGVVFEAYNPNYDFELWHSTVRAGHARLVDDINPGVGESYPSDLTRLGSKVLFSADDGTHGRELWITDGNAAATHLVTDIRTA